MGARGRSFVPSEHKHFGADATFTINQEIVMKSNAVKSVVSFVAAAVFALLSGCASVPSADSAADAAMPVDRGTGTL